MAQNPKLQAGRAIASVMIQRYIFYPLISLTVIMMILWLFSLTFAGLYSSWWLVLSFVMFLWLIIGFSLTAISLIIFSKLRPRKLNRNEKSLIGKFTTDFAVRYGAAKGVKKSPTALSVVVAWKYIKGRGKQSVSDVFMDPINDVRDLKFQFKTIVDLFQ